LDFGFWILDFGLGVGIGSWDFGFWTRNAKGKANANSTSFGFWIGTLDWGIGAWGLVIGNWGLGLGTWGVCLGGLNFNPKSAWCAKLSGNPNSSRIRKIQNPKSLMLLSLYSTMRSVWQLLVTVSELTKL
jgi:hypothetical protein